MGRLALRGRRPRRQASRQGTREPEHFPWRTTMIVPNLHKEPARARHRHSPRPAPEYRPECRLPKIAPYTSMMVSVSEFADAALHFPILFVRSAPGARRRGNRRPRGIVFGLKAGENLFVTDDEQVGRRLRARHAARVSVHAGAHRRLGSLGDRVRQHLGRHFAHQRPAAVQREGRSHRPAQQHPQIRAGSWRADIERTRQACADRCWN